MSNFAFWLKSSCNLLLLGLLFLLAPMAGVCLAQDGPSRIDVYLDEKYSTSFDVQKPDSLDAFVHAVIHEQQLGGYYLASLDSIDWSRSRIPQAIYISKGPLMRIQHVAIDGVEQFDERELLALFDTEVGRVLLPEQLSADIDRVLRFYEARGYPFTQIAVKEIQTISHDENNPGITLVLQVEEGGQARINDVLIIGSTRTRQSYIEYLSGLKRGDVLDKDLDETRARLLDTEHFAQVLPVELIDVGKNEYIAVIQVEENAPGTFDLVLGYQPPAAGGNSTGLVGNGHLDLRNMFGMGRRIALRLNRLPGQISSLEAAYGDPYFWGSPLSIEGKFHGIQQDSTYNQQSYTAGLGYRLFDGVDVFATVNREVVRPGQSGTQIVRGRQRIARSDVTFWGFSIRYKKLDSVVNPRRGMRLETGVEGGRKKRSDLQLEPAGDTTMVTQRLQQQRLNMSIRGYIPTFKNQTLVLGNDTRILVSDDFDVSDLFRLGGAQSLRGYDEDRFRGRVISRLLVEWRYLFERTSYVYLFFDAGYVDRPQTADFDEERNIYPGYGLGMQFQTGIGLINTTLALSTLDAPSQAKVHVGLSFGL